MKLAYTRRGKAKPRTVQQQASEHNVSTKPTGSAFQSAKLQTNTVGLYHSAWHCHSSDTYTLCRYFFVTLVASVPVLRKPQSFITHWKLSFVRFLFCEKLHFLPVLCCVGKREQYSTESKTGHFPSSLRSEVSSRRKGALSYTQEKLWD